MSIRAPTKYKTTNRPSRNAGPKQRGSLSIWFDPGMVRVPPPSGKRGRQHSFNDAAIQACLTLKVLFGLPLRQTTGFVQSLPKLVGLDWAAPDFRTLCRRQKTLNVSLSYRGGAAVLARCIFLSIALASRRQASRIRRNGFGGFLSFPMAFLRMTDSDGCSC